MLNLFKLEYLSFDVRIPDGGPVLQLWMNMRVIGSLSDLTVLGLNVSFDKAGCAVTVAVILSMWEFQDTPLDMSTPK